MLQNANGFALPSRSADAKLPRAALGRAILEPGSHAGETAESLALELRDVATWLALSRIVATKKGSLAKALAQSLRGA